MTCTVFLNIVLLTVLDFLSSSHLFNHLVSTLVVLHFSGQVLLEYIGETIPKLKTRQGAASQQQSSSTAAAASAGGKKGKGKKKWHRGRSFLDSVINLSSLNFGGLGRWNLRRIVGGFSSVWMWSRGLVWVENSCKHGLRIELYVAEYCYLYSMII